MDIRKLQRAIVDGLEDVKAQRIAVFNTEALSPLFERVIIASGTSNRQTKALAASVRDTVKSRGMQVLRTEGEDNGEWIIVDCGAAVAHIMQPSIREYYHLEEIWGGKPVRLKQAVAAGRLPKASEPEQRVVKAGAGRTSAPASKRTAVPAAKKAASPRAAAGAKSAGRRPGKSASSPSAKPVASADQRSAGRPRAQTAAQKATQKATQKVARPSASGRPAAPRKVAQSSARRAKA